MQTVAEPNLPGAKLSAAKMPGHWLLARLGKRVLRPGGLELTRSMLKALAIHSSDAVVEFAPGLGMTTRLALDRYLASYTAIEADEAPRLKSDVCCRVPLINAWCAVPQKHRCRKTRPRSFTEKPC